MRGEGTGMSARRRSKYFKFFFLRRPMSSVREGLAAAPGAAPRRSRSPHMPAAQLQRSELNLTALGLSQQREDH